MEPMDPVQSPSLMHGVPQVARQVPHCCTQANPQSQLPADVHVSPKVAQTPPPALEPPAPDGVKKHPLASRHVDSEKPPQVPSGVPTQLGDQKHPEIALHDWYESAVP